MLQNLHEIAISSRQRYRDEFTASEIVLSDTFKNAFGESVRRDGQSVDFTAHTAIVTTSGNLKMYIPNQWFCAAAYTVPFIQEFLQYKNLLWDKIMANLYATSQERKDTVRKLKDGNDQTFKSSFQSSMTGKLASYVPTDELEETADFLMKFVSDYDWWYGNKTIDRSDCYVSPVLSLLGVVNVSQGYIADISYKFATQPRLAAAALDMIDTIHIDSQDDVTALHPVQEDLQRLTGGINEIIYGAPGTGKSKMLDDTYVHNTRSSRVVFHPEYTFFDFVGTYKPVPVYKTTDTELHTLGGDCLAAGEPYIDYRYIPGPFINTLVNAWLDPNHMHSLIIEEINRANTAAVFGEIFQLLDRDVNGTSEYGIDPSYDLKQYLLSIPDMKAYIANGLRIPSNMNIVATMNSADQGVMPMDSAFKRRWSFRYVRIAIEGAVHEYAPLRYANQEVSWGNLVRAINHKLISLGFEEDRLIGPYFIKPEEIGNKRATDKLLLYLWDDVLRHNRSSFFNSNIGTFADLSDKFISKDVFNLYENPETEKLLNAPMPVAENIEENENTDLSDEQ